MFILFFAFFIHAQKTPEQFQRVYATSKRMCDLRIGTINNKASQAKETIRRGSPFEIEMQAGSYETLLAAADFDCSMAESYAASAGIEIKTQPVVIPPEMHVFIPRKNAEMKSDLMAAYQENRLSSPLATDSIPAIPDFKKAPLMNIRCVPAGFIIANTSDFAYDRDCKAPNSTALKVFGTTKEIVDCAPRSSTGDKRDRYKSLSMCHPMLYGVIPQRSKDGKMYAQAICAFPEDFDSVSFNRSHTLGKHCEVVSDYAASQFLPKEKNDERRFDERMLEFIARTNLKNYEDWTAQSQNILKHCKSTDNSREQESCRAIRPRVEAIENEIQRLLQTESSTDPENKNIR